MKKKLTNNLAMKVISLFLALLFWLVVVSIEDPEGTKELELQVTKINENLFRENDKTYEVISGNTVSITVSARQSILKELGARDFEAIADFSNLSFTGAVPIEIRTLRYGNQVTILKGLNTMMQISIEELASVDKVISAKAEGTVITGKAIGSIGVEPNMLRIEGAKTAIDRIASVYAVVNVSGISDDTAFEVKPILYDSSGNEIDSTDLTFSEEKIKVNVTLLDTKMVPVEWDINVTAAEGYGIESLDYTPSEVEISGTPEVLADIESIVLEDYVAENISEDLEASVDLETIVREKGAFLVRPETDRTVKLAVKLDAYEKRAAFVNFDNIELRGQSDTYKYSVIGEQSISYTLYGLKMDVEMLDLSRLDFFVDVSNLEPGTHTLNLQMDTEEPVWLASEVPIKIKIDTK